MADSFTVTRDLAVPADAVYAAFTTPEQFARWWGTAAVEVPIDSVTLDARPGGVWAARMVLPDGGATIDWSGEYTEVDPPRRLAFTMRDDPSIEAGAPVVVEIDEIDGGSRLRLTQTTPEFSEEQQQAAAAGYAGFFDELARVVGSA